MTTGSLTHDADVEESVGREMSKTEGFDVVGEALDEGVALSRAFELGEGEFVVDVLGDVLFGGGVGRKWFSVGGWSNNEVIFGKILRAFEIFTVVLDMFRRGGVAAVFIDFFDGEVVSDDFCRDEGDVGVGRGVEGFGDAAPVDDGPILADVGEFGLDGGKCVDGLGATPQSPFALAVPLADGDGVASVGAELLDAEGGSALDGAAVVDDLGAAAGLDAELELEALLVLLGVDDDDVVLTLGRAAVCTAAPLHIDEALSDVGDGEVDEVLGEEADGLAPSSVLAVAVVGADDGGEERVGLEAVERDLMSHCEVDGALVDAAGFGDEAEDESVRRSRRAAVELGLAVGDVGLSLAERALALLPLTEIGDLLKVFFFGESVLHLLEISRGVDGLVVVFPILDGFDFFAIQSVVFAGHSEPAQVDVVFSDVRLTKINRNKSFNLLNFTPRSPFTSSIARTDDKDVFSSRSKSTNSTIQSF